MQQEFYIGQKVKTSQIGIKRDCPVMEGIVDDVSFQHTGQGVVVVKYDHDGRFVFYVEEIESSGEDVPYIVFDNIVKSL